MIDRVRASLARSAACGPVPIGDVGRHAEDAAGRTGAVAKRRLHGQVGVDDAVERDALFLGQRDIRGDHPAVHLAVALGGFARGDVEVRLADGLGNRAAEQLDEARIHEQVAAFEILRVDHGGGVVGHRLEEDPALVEHPLGPGVRIGLHPQGLIGRFELRRPRAHARLELVIQLGERPFGTHQLAHVPRGHLPDRDDQGDVGTDLGDVRGHRGRIVRSLRVEDEDV